MRSIKIFLIIIAFSTSPLFGFFESSGRSGFPGEYLYMFSGGARGLALGIAQVALSGNANLCYSNPASLGALWWQELGYSYTPLFAGSQLTNVSYGYPLAKNHVLGLSLTTLSSTEGEKTDDLGRTLGSFSDKETTMMFTYANKLTPNLHAGINAKFVTQEIDSYYAKGMGMDAGLIYYFTPYHYWAANFMNLVRPSLGPDTFPMITKLGFWHSFLSKKLSFTADVMFYNLFGGGDTSNPTLFYGLEYSYNRILDLRMGLNNKQASAGFGIKTKHADFDYAFVYHSLDILHSLSVNIRFGFLPSEAEAKIKEGLDDLNIERKDFVDSLEIERSKIYTERKKLKLQTKLTMDFHRALELYNQEQYEMSKGMLEKILKADSSFEEAKKLLLEIQARLDKNIVKIKYLEAKKFYEKGFYSDSLQAIDYILKIDSVHHDAIVLRFLVNTRTLLNEKKYSDAKNELIELLKIEPGNDEAMQLLKRVQNIIEMNK